MVYSNVRVKVTDYAAWRSMFDQGESMRRAAGSTGVNHVYRDVDDPNMITVIMEWDSAENARKFMNDPALKDAQQKAGFTGPPVVSTILSAA